MKTTRMPKHVLAVILAVAILGGMRLGGKEVEGDDVETPAQSSEKLFEQATDALGHQRWAEARALFRQMPPGSPGFTTALHNLAILDAMAGDHEAARRTFTELVQLQPDDTEAWVGLGWSEFELGRFADARRATAKAIELDPANSNARANLGLFWLADGRLDTCLDALREAYCLGGAATAVSVIQDVREYSGRNAADPNSHFVLALFFTLSGASDEAANALTAYQEATASSADDARRRLDAAVEAFRAAPEGVR